ncbi:hypothetical protein JANAI62_03650 [Jannaschia pagri]|uniref:Right handed beta helix domain-containing protein n=2 Tax=Roseobacteraceae TaxID=2854170 RepID=A0ABQ4NH32_9RHOB|nr:hypothetical protein JANAI61_06100 [Jannaschia sp. AI_61]GIT93742.1 hypothetical protein JANAI62_03650 [Jannaschia sp. AI_62]
MVADDGLTVFVNNDETTAFTINTNLVNGVDDQATLTFDAELRAGDQVIVVGRLIPYRSTDYLPTDPSLTKHLNTELTELNASIVDLWREVGSTVRVVPDPATGLRQIQRIPVLGANRTLVGDGQGGFRQGPDANDPIVLPLDPTRAFMAASTQAVRDIELSKLVAGAQVFVADNGTFQWDAASTLADDGVFTLAPSEGGAGRWLRIYDPANIHVKWFGTLGVSNESDTEILQRAALFFVETLQTNCAQLVLPPAITVTDSIDFTSTGGKKGTICGANNGGAISTIVTVAYHGYGPNAKQGAVFQMGDPDAPAYQTEIGIRGIEFGRAGSQFNSPVFIDHVGAAQIEFNEIRIGSSNNTAIRVATPQNCVFDRIRTFSGGRSFQYKDATGVTVRQAGTTLTASGPIFSASDEGKTVNVWGTGSSTLRRKIRIVEVTSSTTATAAYSANDTVDRALYFGSPWATLTAGSVEVTVDAPIATSDVEGLVVVFRDGGTNRRPFRAKIISTDGDSTLTLDQPAPVSAVSEFAVACVEFLGSSFGNGPSDNDMPEFNIESFAGYGMYVDDMELFRMDGKFHPDQTPQPARYPLEHIVADRWGGEFEGVFDAQNLGSARVYVTNLNTAVSFKNLRWRSAGEGDVLAEIGPQSDVGGIVVFDAMQRVPPFQSGAQQDPFGWVIDANNGTGYAWSGTVTSSNSATQWNFLGTNVWADGLGNMTIQGNVKIDGDVQLGFADLTASFDTLARFGPTTNFLETAHGAPTNGFGWQVLHVPDKTGDTDSGWQLAHRPAAGGMPYFRGKSVSTWGSWLRLASQQETKREFTTRAELVTWWAANSVHVPEGNKVRVRKAAWRVRKASTVIADLPGLDPIEPYRPEHFGPAGTAATTLETTASTRALWAFARTQLGKRVRIEFTENQEYVLQGASSTFMGDSEGYLLVIDTDVHPSIEINGTIRAAFPWAGPVGRDVGETIDGTDELGLFFFAPSQGRTPGQAPTYDLKITGRGTVNLRSIPTKTFGVNGVKTLPGYRDVWVEGLLFDQGSLDQQGNVVTAANPNWSDTGFGGDSALDLGAADSMTIERNRFIGAKDCAVYLSGGNGQFDETVSLGAPYTYFREGIGRRVYIANNRAMGCDNFVQMKRFVRDCMVVNNIVEDGRNGISTGATNTSGTRNDGTRGVISGNTIRRCNGNAIFVSSGELWRIANNEITDFRCRHYQPDVMEGDGYEAAITVRGVRLAHVADNTISFEHWTAEQSDTANHQVGIITGPDDDGVQTTRTIIADNLLWNMLTGIAYDADGATSISRPGNYYIGNGVAERAV